MQPMIDSHCHLAEPCFEQDLKQLLLHAKQTGIQQIIIPGTHHEQWARQCQIKKEHQGISNAFGIHPWYCDQHHAHHLQQLETLLKDAIAIGECGLDFSPNKPAEKIQFDCFQQQLQLALQYQLPVIIHSVKSADQIAKVLRQHSQLRGVIHGFSGSLQQAEVFIKLGFHIGIGSRLLHSHAKKIHHLAGSLPLTSILLETDAPNGLGHQQRNEPSHLLAVAQCLARMRDIPLACIQQQCTQNTKELFSL